MNETPTPGATPSNPPIPRNPQPVEQVPVQRDAPQPAPGILARVRAWFAAAVATVKTAAAPPQAQQGTDLVDTAPPLVDASAGWWGKARAALGRVGAWLAEMGRVWPVGWIVWVAALLIGIILLAIYSDKPDVAQEPAAAQTNPLTPLVDRLDAMAAQVATLQGQVADLQRSQQPQAAAPRRSAAQRTAPAPSTQTAPEPERRRWGATDLDRAITDFTPPTTFGARP